MEMEIAATIPGDDSAGFDDLERTFVRRFVPDFDWVVFDQPSPGRPLPVPLPRARVGLVATAGAHLPEQEPMSPTGEAIHHPARAAILACFVANPFGLTLGSVRDHRTHDGILRAALTEAERPHPPGTIHPLPFRLAGDLRARQALTPGRRWPSGPVHPTTGL